ncbi:MAG: hypothetical protein IJS19_09135 [Muribaculaceae bacterium]|nr:hypothetical protein [Muribaculaceae bacterium]
MKTKGRRKIEIDMTRLRELIESGMSALKTAAALGISATTVAKRCEQYGIIRPITRTKADVSKVEELIAVGLTAQAAAVRLGVTKDTIMDVVRKNDIAAPWQKKRHKTTTEKKHEHRGRTYFEIIRDGRTASFKDIKRRDMVFDYIVGKGLQVWKSASGKAATTYDHLPASAVYLLFAK